MGINYYDIPDVGQKVSIVNALMHEDRQELRFHKGALFNTTIVFCSAYTAVSAYFLQHRETSDLVVPLSIIAILFFVHVVIFLFLWRFINTIRRCLDIREEYYKSPDKFVTEKPFNPLKSINEASLDELSIPDNYLLLIPVISILCAASNIVALWHLFS